MVGVPGEAAAQQPQAQPVTAAEWIGAAICLVLLLGSAKWADVVKRRRRARERDGWDV